MKTCNKGLFVMLKINNRLLAWGWDRSTGEISTMCFEMSYKDVYYDSVMCNYKGLSSVNVSSKVTVLGHRLNWFDTGH